MKNDSDTTRSLIRCALERSHNHLKYQYETDKQKLMRMGNPRDQGAVLTGLNILASVLKQNEKALEEE